MRTAAATVRSVLECLGDRPSPELLRWHGEEVFGGERRQSGIGRGPRPILVAPGMGPRHRRDMTREELLGRISIDPAVCFGKPCIKGHRIWVSLILDFLASGMTSAEIRDEYPGIEEADVLACIAYGAEMARERYLDLDSPTTR